MTVHFKILSFLQEHNTVTIKLSPHIQWQSVSESTYQHTSTMVSLKIHFLYISQNIFHCRTNVRPAKRKIEALFFLIDTSLSTKLLANPHTHILSIPPEAFCHLKSLKSMFLWLECNPKAFQKFRACLWMGVNSFITKCRSVYKLVILSVAHFLRLPLEYFFHLLF